MHTIDSTPAQAPKPGFYRHYKGNLYQVLGMARHSETEEWLVVYQALYAERGYWVRPLALWLEPVDTPKEAMGGGDAYDVDTASNRINLSGRTSSKGEEFPADKIVRFAFITSNEDELNKLDEES